MLAKQRKYKGIVAARISRKNMTKTEQLLWKYLRDNRTCGFKFRRQHPVDGFVVDFYCPKANLAVELDGGIHVKQKERDLQRQRIIESKGIRFLRFKNSKIFKNIENVLKEIKQSIVPLHKVERDVPSVVEGQGEEGEF